MVGMLSFFENQQKWSLYYIFRFQFSYFFVKMFLRRFVLCLLPLLLFVPCGSSFSLSALFPSNKSTTPLMCYRGIKYFVGQEDIDDNVRCDLNVLERKITSMDKYCYKFTSHIGISDFVKRGCSVMICSGLRNGCAKLEFEGVHGEMCCCSESSYCNRAPGKWHRQYFILALFIISLSSLTVPLRF